MAITVGQFLEFINIHKFKNKYNSVKDITLNDVRSLTNSDIYSFIYFLAESQYKINSRVVKIEHLRTFFNYLFTIKHTIFTEPFKKINSERKIEKKLPNYLSLDEAKRMIEVYANSIDEIEIRDNAILHLFLVRDKLNPKTKKLFVSRYGLKMSSTGIEKIVKRAYEKAEIDDEDYCVHTLRHTCATLLYRNGVDIRTIQEILGHVQIDTTEIYTHLHDQEVMDAMLDHPLSQFKMANAEAFCA